MNRYFHLPVLDTTNDRVVVFLNGSTDGTSYFKDGYMGMEWSINEVCHSALKDCCVELTREEALKLISHLP
jgi:hypothetical protein